MQPDAANAEEFRRQGYTRIAGFLPAAVVRVVVEECWILQRNGFFKRNDAQVPDAPSGYAPLPIEALMRLATPFMEKIVGRALWPTYSYMRIYERGNSLERHQDRDACEFSVSVALASATPEPWPLHFRMRSGEERSLDLAPGDAVIYRGGLLEHWRDPLTAEWHMQAFMHFVDRDGPHAAWKYDKRADLGRPPIHGRAMEG